MKTTCEFRSWMIFEALLYLAEASSANYIYYSEASTVLLKCSRPSEMVEWLGPAHFNIFNKIQELDMFGHIRWWNVTAYTEGQFIIPTLPHRNRLQVITGKRTYDFDLQINNASILDEGLYFCKMRYYYFDDVWYILKMINSSRTRYKYYPEGSTALLKCLLDMEWFGPAHFNSLYQSPVIAMHENRSMWTVDRYTEGKSISPSLPHHNRLKVIRRIQTGDYELQISNASILDEGLYFCKDSEMHTVPDYYILKLINTPKVSSLHDMIEEINEGETQKLCCYLDNKPTLTSTKWLKENKTVLVTQNDNETCYTIISVTRHDQGHYTCIAENVIGSGSITVVLKVKYKPVVSSMHNIIEEINEGKTKTLCCDVDSYPPPTSTRWLNGSQELLVTHYVKGTCYTIRNISRHDQGPYTCIAENVIGNGSFTTTLEVKYKPLVSSMHDTIEEINEGESKKLCCYVDSNPKSTSTRWLNGVKEMLVTHNVNKTCYTIKSVNRYDQRNYTCIAENIIGIGSVTIVLKVKYKPEVSSSNDLIEEINEGETKILCCYVDSNPEPISTRWLNGSQEILITHNVAKTCYTIKNVSRYDQGNYTCIAHNAIGNGSITTVLQFKSNYSFRGKAQSLQNVVIVVLLGTIGALFVGIGILFFHLKRKNKQRRISTINSETRRGYDDASGHYMEIFIIDDNIVTPWQENNNPIISTIERAVVENRDIALASAGHSSASSDDDRNASGYLDDGYEHQYNMLLANNRAEDEHVYLSPKKTSNNANSTPFENAACGCSYEFTEQDSLPDKTESHCYAGDGEKNIESEL